MQHIARYEDEVISNEIAKFHIILDTKALKYSCLVK